MPWVLQTNDNSICIKDEQLSDRVCFSTTGKAQVSQAVHDHLVDTYGSINSTDDTDPGDPTKKTQSENQAVTYSAPTDSADYATLIANVGNLDELDADRHATDALLHYRDPRR